MQKWRKWASGVLTLVLLGTTSGLAGGASPAASAPTVPRSSATSSSNPAAPTNGRGTRPVSHSVYQSAYQPSLPVGQSVYENVYQSTGVELTSLRTSYSDTFRNANGSFTTHEYAVPKYYKNAEGQWQNITTALIPSVAPGFAFQNTTNLVQSRFAATAGGAALTLVSIGNDSVGLAPVGTPFGASVEGSVYGQSLDLGSASGTSVEGSVYGSVYQSADQNVGQSVYQSVDQSVYGAAYQPAGGYLPLSLQIRPATAAQVGMNSVKYAGVFSGVDYEYAAIPGGMKESIVLDRPMFLDVASAQTGAPRVVISTSGVQQGLAAGTLAGPSFSFALFLQGLTAVSERNGIALKDASGNTVLWMPEPVLTDAAGHTSTDATMTLSGDTVTIAPNATFLAGATYPVTIDPSVMQSVVTSDMDVTMQNSPQTTTEVGPWTQYSQTQGYSGNVTLSGASQGLMRSYVWMPALLLWLPPGVTAADVSSATLNVEQNNPNEGGDPIGAFPSVGCPDESALDWANQGDYPPAATADDTLTAATTPADNSVDGLWSWDVTNTVKSWLDATNSGCGWWLIDDNEATTTNFAQWNVANEPPNLSVTYTVHPIGSEPFWTQDGHGVNPADGNLTLAATDLSTGGLGGGFALTRTYNSQPDASAPGHQDLFGPGFASDLDMSLAVHPSSSGAGVAVFTDANGLQHIFVNAGPQAPPNRWLGAPAEHLSFNGSSVSEENGTTFDFDSQGRLADITTTGRGGTWLTTTLDRNASGQLTGITDPSGRLWTVIENPDGTIASIQGPAGRITTYAYDAAGYLTSVSVTGAQTTDSKDTSSTTIWQYGYNSNTPAELTNVTDADGNTVQYSYDANAQVNRIGYYYHTSRSQAAMAWWNYEYTPWSAGEPAITTVTDPNGNKVEYQTNPWGNVTEFIQGATASSGGALNLTTQYQWDIFDDLTQITFPNGKTEQMGCDPGGNGMPTSAADQNGSQSLYSYDPLAAPAGAMSRDGATTSSSHSGSALLDVIDAMGNDSMENVDARGQVTSASVPVGVVPSSPVELLQDQDFLNTAAETVQPDDWNQHGLHIGDGLDYSTLHAGYVSERMAGNGQIELISETLPAPTFAVASYEISGWSMTSTGYTGNGLILQATYANGQTQSATANFQQSTAGWQYASDSATLPSTLGGAKMTSLTFAAMSQQPSGTVWFSDLRLLASLTNSTSQLPNLVQDPGFEVDGWQNASGTGAGQAFRTSDTSRTGLNSMELVPAATGSGATTTTVISPSIALSGKVTPLTAVGFAHTSGLQGDTAYISLTAYDATGKSLGTWRSQALGASSAVHGIVPWMHVSISVPASSFSASDPPTSAVISLNQAPDAAGSNGASYFDDIGLYQQDLFSHFTYNSQDNYLTSVTDELGNVTSLSPDANTGDVASTIDPRGHATSFSYDKFDDMLSTTVPYQAYFGAAVQNESYAYGYDAVGNVLSATAPNGAKVTSTYNELGQPLTATEPVNGTAETTTFSYDSGGRLINETLPNSANTTYTYDSANRVTSVTHSKPGAASQTFTYSYDADSNVAGLGPIHPWTTQPTASEQVSYGYDSANRLTSVQYTKGSQVSSETRTLDPSGNTTKIAFSVSQYSGSATQAWNIGHVWDAGAHLSSLTDTQGSAVNTAQYQYTTNGDVSSVMIGTAQVTYTYDPDGRVSQVIGESGGKQFLDKRYAYDVNGNVTSVEDVLSNINQVYAYDSQNQLEEEPGDSFTYDALGNRLSESATDGWPNNTTYQYDTEGNRLQVVTNTIQVRICPQPVYLTSVTPKLIFPPPPPPTNCNPDSTTTYNVTYDAAGNLLTDGTNTYAWNAANQLASITSGSTTHEYTYDGFGRRIGVDGDAVYYYGTSDQVAYVTDDTDNVLFRISDDGAGRPQFITVYQNGTPLTYAYVYDGLGNVVGLVDDNSSNSTYNQEVVTYSYDAWGNVLSETDNSGIGLAKTNPLLYKGYWYEWSTGLYYLNARYYNPAWGRFISKDALGVQPGDAASYNEYEYAANNPVSFSDPTGYMPVALPGVPNNPNLPAQVVHKEVMQQYLQYLGYLSFLQELSDGLSAAALAASGVALACGGDTLATLPAAEVGVLEATGACTAGALLWADGSAIGSGAVVTLMDVQRARYGQGSWTQVWLDSSGVLFSILGFASPGLSADDPVNAQVLHMIAEKLSAISWGWSLHNRSSTP